MSDDGYMLNIHGKVISITESPRKDVPYVRVTMKLEDAFMDEPFVLDIPIGWYLLHKFIPGKRIQVRIDED